MFHPDGENPRTQLRAVSLIPHIDLVQLMGRVSASVTQLHETILGYCSKHDISNVKEDTLFLSFSAFSSRSGFDFHRFAIGTGRAPNLPITVSTTTIVFRPRPTGRHN